MKGHLLNKQGKNALEIELKLEKNLNDRNNLVIMKFS